MERRRLGRSGLTVPVIGLGTYRVLHAKDDEGEARSDAVVTVALQAGAKASEEPPLQGGAGPGSEPTEVGENRKRSDNAADASPPPFAGARTLFDTSPMYGEAERVLALSLAGRREQAVVATKVWARTRAIGEMQVERALAWFERVELYQIHNMLQFRDHLPYLQHLRDAGRVGALGVTHFLASEIPSVLDAMEAGLVDTVSLPYNPRRRDIEAELLPAAERLDVGVIAMKPFDTGPLVSLAPDPAALAPLRDFGVHTWAQALLKWCLSDPRVHCAIPATSSPARMAENAAAGEPPWFGPAERRLVESLANAV